MARAASDSAAVVVVPRVADDLAPSHLMATPAVAPVVEHSAARSAVDVPAAIQAAATLAATPAVV